MILLTEPAKTGGSTSAIIVKKFCDPTSEVGDTVFLSNVDVDTVISNSNHKNTNQTIGLILEKITEDYAKILLFGKEIFTFDTYLKNSKIFLGIDGKLTTVPPTDGFLHILGVCLENDEIFFNPYIPRIKRTPFE